jgi:OOP family OmpA-OmpF porin
MEEHPMSFPGQRLTNYAEPPLVARYRNARVWRWSRPSRLAAGASLVAASLLLAPATHAQEDATEGSFTVQRFNPAPGPRNFITTRAVRSAGEMAWSGAFMANWGYKPFVVVTCEALPPADCDDPDATDLTDVYVVENVATGDFMGSLTPIPPLQVSLRVPVTFVKGQGMTETGEAADIDGDGLQAVGLGDAELEGKYRFWNTLGAGLFLTAPFGDLTAEGEYIGDATATVGLRGIVDFSQGPFLGAVNLSGVYRGEGRVGTTTLGPEFRYGLAFGYEVSPLVQVMADGFGATKFSSTSGTNTLETDVAARIHPVETPFYFTVGGGVGLLQGIGVPVGRAFLGFMYVHEAMDRDRDGLTDEMDECPAVAEDLDGFDDGDGCPDLDNDDDTIYDADDKCPDQAEDPDGFQDTDGCPDPDNDGDGIPDDRDGCPNEPETKNNYKDEDGCPDEADRDEDGVPDSRDKCPDGPEDTDGHDDTDGCPDPDNDGDGIPDIQDECIDQAETVNGVDDEDGCPDGEPGAEAAEPPAAEGFDEAPAPAQPAPAPAE